MLRICLIWMAFSGDPLQEFLYGGDAIGDQQIIQELTATPEVEDNREVLNIWTASWCGPCRRLHQDVDAAGELPFRINWIDADKVPLPADVPNGIPHAEWADRKWYTKPSNGLEDLKRRYLASTGKKPPPVEPVSSQTASPPAMQQQMNPQSRHRRGRRGRW